MAERRMFAQTIIDSDAFLDMPLSAQALYFHLGMRADDDGFINNPKKVQRSVGASEDDLKLLILKNFIIPFESGIVVIKHWRIHNYIRNDRRKGTVYLEEMALLDVKSNGAYTLVNQLSTNCQPSDNQVTDNCPHRLGKVSIGKVSIGEVRREEGTPEANRYGVYNNVILTPEERDALMNDYPDEYAEMIDKLSMYMKSSGKLYKDHYATIRKWKREDDIKASKSASAKKGSKEELQDFYNMMDDWAANYPREEEEKCDPKNSTA